MKRLMVWVLWVAAAGSFFGARPAYAPLVTVQEEPAEEEENISDNTGVIDLSDMEDAESKPTWSPSFENQKPK